MQQSNYGTNFEVEPACSIWNAGQLPGNYPKPNSCLSCFCPYSLTERCRPQHRNAVGDCLSWCVARGLLRASKESFTRSWSSQLGSQPETAISAYSPPRWSPALTGGTRVETKMVSSQGACLAELLRHCPWHHPACLRPSSYTFSVWLYVFEKRSLCQ